MAEGGVSVLATRLARPRARHSWSRDSTTWGRGGLGRGGGWSYQAGVELDDQGQGASSSREH